jgi:hypothetical protein
MTSPALPALASRPGGPGRATQRATQRWSGMCCPPFLHSVHGRAADPHPLDSQQAAPTLRACNTRLPGSSFLGHLNRIRE